MSKAVWDVPVRLERTQSAEGIARRLTVLHVATINKPVSSQLGYGPIETVIYNLDKGLHTRGHRSIVACSADSTVAGERYATVSKSLGDYLREWTPEAQAHVDLHLSRALARAQKGDVDVIHMHEWFERVYCRSFNPPVPIVMTLHVPGPNSGIAEFDETHPAVVQRRQPHFVAISDYQLRQYADLAPVAETIPHGVDLDEYIFRDEPETAPYLLSIGRITRVKGQDIAIQVARRSGAKLILAGCVQDNAEDRAFFSSLRSSLDLVIDVGRHPVGDDYFDRVMKPILSSDAQVIYIGEVDTATKKHWFRHAQAMLFPIRWGEPFGMVLIESMASGTPVVGFRKGSVPEIVRDGKTGFVVESVESMVEAIASIERIDRRDCQRHVEDHFSIHRMAERYEAVYERLAGAQPEQPRPESGRKASGVAMRPYRRVEVA
jgi:glycosyltransferase involved in cell wall biosynthesis